jgi:hypothetical protein
MRNKQVQSLYTAKNLILIGVPTNTDAESLQNLMLGKMEEARQKMVARSPSKYGSLTKVPQFVINKDYIRNTPYAERLDNDDIPFWAWKPFHLEYLAVDEKKLDQILAYMYHLRRFQRLLGDAAFFHRNPGVDATTGDQGILAGVLMRHIAMVQSMSRVILKGLVHPDWQHLIQWMDKEDPTEIDIEVSRFVCEIMMGNKIHGTKVWVLIAQVPDG